MRSGTTFYCAIFFPFRCVFSREKTSKHNKSGASKCTSKMAELIERCMEEIASTVLDAGDPISYRTLGASSQVSVDISRDALQRFVQENASSVGAIDVVVHHGVLADDKKDVDPRARVIRLGSLPPTHDAGNVVSKQIYSVYKKSGSAQESDDCGEVTEPIAVACWSQERSLRNDIFQKVARQAPLSRAIKCFYASDITCAEATTRTEFGDDQGEESVSVFDSLKPSKKAVASSSSSSTHATSARNGSTQSVSSSSSKSFFKSTATAASKVRTTTGSAAMTSAKTSAPASTQPETKQIDAASMSNVFTIDSDDEEDEDSDADAPVFVKKSSGGAAKPRSKRVISDDDDDDFVDDDTSAKTPAPAAHKKAEAAVNNDGKSSRNVKRKLSTSPDHKSSNHVASSDSDESEKPKSKKRATSMDDEGEEDSNEPAAVVATKRRVEVTKTRINEQGYMVTEKTYEEIELTAEEVEREKIQAAKRKKQQQTAKASAAAAEAKKAAAAAKGGASAKQKNLFAFFQRK